MSSSVKAKPQTFTSNLYGSATTGSSGTTYNPSAFESNLINMTNTYIPQYLEQMVNPSYDSEIFQAQTAQRNRLANQSFENNLINPLASRGLTRGSSVNQMSNQFANKLADLEVDAMANEDTRVANILNNLFTYYKVPYDMMLGISELSGNQYQRAVQNAMMQNKINNDSLSGLANNLSSVGELALKAAQSNNGSGIQGFNASGSGLGSLLGGLAGMYFGGPAGAQVGSMAGSQLGGWLS